MELAKLIKGGTAANSISIRKKRGGAGDKKLIAVLEWADNGGHHVRYRRLGWSSHFLKH